MSTAVNPDALLIASWTFALWLGARVINRRAQGWDVVRLCAATAAAILTKATSYALVGPILVALLIGWLRRPAGERARRPDSHRGGGRGAGRSGARLGGARASSLGGLSITTVGSSPAHPFHISQFLSYLWQFYLPRLPFLKPLRTTPGLPVYDIWLRQLTGTFGWLDVYLPDWMYRVAAVAAAALGVGCRRAAHPPAPTAPTGAAGLLRPRPAGSARRAPRHRVPRLDRRRRRFLQGRYLLPVVGLLGLAVGLVIARVPARIRPSACALALTALLVMQVHLAVHRTARVLPVRRRSGARRAVILPATAISWSRWPRCLSPAPGT